MHIHVFVNNLVVSWLCFLYMYVLRCVEVNILPPITKKKILYTLVHLPCTCTPLIGTVGAEGLSRDTSGGGGGSM